MPNALAQNDYPTTLKWNLTWELVLTSFMQVPVVQFQSRMVRSAVPPPVASRLFCQGHQATAWMKELGLHWRDCFLNYDRKFKECKLYSCPIRVAGSTHSKSRQTQNNISSIEGSWIWRTADNSSDFNKWGCPIWCSTFSPSPVSQEMQSFAWPCPKWTISKKNVLCVSSLMIFHISDSMRRGSSNLTFDFSLSRCSLWMGRASGKS